MWFIYHKIYLLILLWISSYLYIPLLEWKLKENRGSYFLNGLVSFHHFKRSTCEGDKNCTGEERHLHSRRQHQPESYAIAVIERKCTEKGNVYPLRRHSSWRMIFELMFRASLRRWRGGWMTNQDDRPCRGT